MTQIYAETKSGHTFPPHISVSVSDGAVRFLVRGPAKMVSHENGAYFEHGEVGEIELTVDQAVDLAQSIIGIFEQRVFARETAAAEAAAQDHIMAGLNDGRDRRPHPDVADAERAVSFPETVANDGSYLFEPHGEGLAGNGHYIGLTRGADHGDECQCDMHSHARVG